MAKKRIIFCLLVDNGQFCISRNFRIQKVGDLDWLEKKFGFREISRNIDELAVVNVNKTKQFDWSLFLEIVSRLTKRNFVPLTVGGFGEDIQRAKSLTARGADKFVVNTALFSNIPFLEQLADLFGRQAVLGSLDFQNDSQHNGGLQLRNSRGLEGLDLSGQIAHLRTDLLGEVLLRSVSRDGTGHGIDTDVLGLLPPELNSLPKILAGGTGKPEHIVEALANPAVSGVSTSNLFNFIGNRMSVARDLCRVSGIDIGEWDTQLFETGISG